MFSSGESVILPPIRFPALASNAYPTEHRPSHSVKVKGCWYVFRYSLLAPVAL